jgi:outer membrane cobalamin receptor
MRSKLASALCLAAALYLAPPWAVAAGSLTGVVIDGLTGQPVRGVTLVVGGTTVSAQSDVGGAFAVSVEAGAYTVAISKDGFAPQQVVGVVVEEGRAADFAVVLLPDAASPATATAAAEADAAFTGEISVTAEVEESTEAALLAERRASSDIADLIGKQEIGKNTGSDAASVLQTVTGISVQQDKYVFIRGLGERYSSTSLNGSRLPTTEFDKKVVPLDLFPSKLLDKVKVAKTYSPDKAGDFAAGSVELNTLDFPSRTTFELTLGASSDSETTGAAFGEYAGGLSWAGSGGQPLPAAIPADRVVRSNPFLPGSGYTPAELELLGESFVGAWTPSGTAHEYLGNDFADAGLSPNLALTYGDSFGPLGVVVAATHARGFDHTDTNRTFYTLGAGGELRVQNDYDFQTDAESVRRGLVGNLAYRLGDRHKLELRTITSDDAKSESRYFEGYNDDQSTDVNDYRVRYGQEKIGSYQLSGEHFFDAWGDGDLVSWRGSLGTASNQENLRESLYRLENGRYVLTDESQSAFLLFNDLDDELVDGGLDWSHFMSGGSAFGSLQVGTAWSSRDRAFASRRFRYTFRDTSAMDLTLLPDQVLIADNISPTGFEIKEETRPTDSYDATHDVAAAYAMADVTVGKWRLIGGLRYEDSAVDVTTYDPFNLDAEPIVSTLDERDVMPSLAAVYRLSERTNLRAAWSRTVNRPEFRELAPFEFTDVVGGRSARGNPNLQSAGISSFDLRYEWFPDSFGVVAASVFYKDFTDPIERTLLIAVELQSTWQNVAAAENLGLELELRRDLGFLADALAPLSVQLNYTFVDSTIDVGADNQIVTNTERALVGQPDQVVNAILEWQSSALRATSRLIFTATGERIFEAGAFGIPDVVEQPLSVLDFVWKQDLDFLAAGLGAKLSLTNLLDQDVELRGGYDETYALGRGISLSLSYAPF